MKIGWACCPKNKNWLGICPKRWIHHIHMDSTSAHLLAKNQACRWKVANPDLRSQSIYAVGLETCTNPLKSRYAENAYKKAYEPMQDIGFRGRLPSKNWQSEMTGLKKRQAVYSLVQRQKKVASKNAPKMKQKNHQTQSLNISPESAPKIGAWIARKSISSTESAAHIGKNDEIKFGWKISLLTIHPESPTVRSLSS